MMKDEKPRRSRRRKKVRRKLNVNQGKGKGGWNKQNDWKNKRASCGENESVGGFDKEMEVTKKNTGVVKKMGENIFNMASGNHKQLLFK